MTPIHVLTHDLYLFSIAFLSEIVGTLSGFGSSTFFVPGALLVEGFQFVLALTAILHCFGNFFRLILFREHLEWKFIIRLAIPFLIFTALGASLTTVLPTVVMKRTLGGILIVLSIIFLVGKSKIQNLIPKWLAHFLIMVSGFSTGIVGTGGAIRGLALTMMSIPKNNFVFTSSAIDFSGDIIRAIIYLRSGFMDWNHWFYIPLLGMAALIGSKFGQIILNRINQAQFEKIASALVLISGIAMLFEA